MSDPISHDRDRAPQPTGDPLADAILQTLREAGELTPAEEIAAYREALDALTRLMDEQPPMPGHA